MKKTFLLFAALFAGIGLTTAQTLTIPDVYILPGGKASFGLVVDVPANSYAGFQFETTLPTGISYTEETTVSSDWDGSFQTSATNFKGSASSMKLTPIPAGEIVIATAEIEADPSMTPGSYIVTISNFEFLGYSGGAEDKKIADLTFNVIVTDRLVLDEASIVAPAAATNVNVLVKRTINANEWSTIVLPFALSKTKAETAFGSDVQLAEFNGYEVDYGDDDANVIPLGITIKLASVTLTSKKGMTAGKPYLIKTSKDIESFDVDGVTIIEGVTDISKPDENDTPGKMTGTFVKTKVPADGLFVNDNKFWYSTGKTNIKAFRCWFELGAVLDKETDFSAPVFFSFGGETTGIENIQRTAGDDRYYNLNGQHVENLKKGQIYIKNNKKVVVK
jgi:hypothetical protein